MPATVMQGIYYMIRALVLDRAEISPSCASPRYSRSFALLSVLAALYLVLALSVPGAFLIAKQAATTVFWGQAIVLAELYSTQQFEGGAGEDEGEHSSWQGPKRLRGALPLPKTDIDSKIVKLLIAALPGPKMLLEEDAQANKLVAADEVQPPSEESFPRELLGRSPPPSL